MEPDSLRTNDSHNFQYCLTAGLPRTVTTKGRQGRQQRAGAALTEAERTWATIMKVPQANPTVLSYNQLPLLNLIPLGNCNLG